MNCSVLACMMVLVGAPIAHSAIVINELMGSTTSTDAEFIELYNTGSEEIDLTGWSIELWESDSGMSGADGSSPYVITTGTISVGGYFLLGGPEFAMDYGITPDQSLPASAIENSSATLILLNDEDVIVESFFINDGGAGDAPNRDGVAITVDHEISTGGSGYPAGFYRVGDGGSSFALLEYSPSPAPSATPGAANIPEPSLVLLLAVFAAFFLVRRHRD